MFTDRPEAGRILGEKVTDYLRQAQATGRPLVLGLPRGGVPVAYAVAEAVGGELDVMVARKIGLPGQPEFGIGAVTSQGPPLLDHRVLGRVGLTDHDLAPAVARERAEAVRRLREYRGEQAEPQVGGRVAVVVDDGLATGVTARAALRALRAQRPERLIFAAPVCAADSIAGVQAESDAAICVHCPADFGAVGSWYTNFEQTTDEEVVRLLSAARSEWASR